MSTLFDEKRKWIDDNIEMEKQSNNKKKIESVMKLKAQKHW